jgi:type I site-specific restriction-modification system R (restriction) subunit
MPAYTEDQLVEQPAIGLFAELGWTAVLALEETFGTSGTLWREAKGEVVLVSRLRLALERLNLALPPEAIPAAVDELTRDLLLPRLLSGQEALAFVSANGAFLCQPGATPQVSRRKYQEG